jgi:NTP pyrophosphatase (non-canonical NTP hydrolase)
LYALEQSILGWAHERNLIHGSTCRKQLAKTCEEFGELAAGLNKNKRDLIKDGVGDVLVTLIIANGCAGGTDIFMSEPAGNDWAIILQHRLLEQDSSEVVLKLLCELDYITELSRTKLYTWRTERMRDMIRWLVVAAQRAECSLAECLLTAWMEIKDRKGRMVDGVFVKEADLPQQTFDGVFVAPDHNC